MNSGLMNSSKEVQGSESGAKATQNPNQENVWPEPQLPGLSL